MPLPECFSGGVELQFFDKNSLNGCERQEDPLSIVKHAFSILLMGWPQKKSWGNLVHLRTIRAVLLKRDPALMRYARLAFQEGFTHLYHQLRGHEFSDTARLQIEFYISNCLCILPFTDLNPYESISIPQCINNVWTLVEYKVTPIELTPTEGLEHLLLEDKDRVFAYGLTPLENDLATSHLIFMGTTYPAGQGLRAQLRADMNGFRTSGEILYQYGRQKISDWLSQQPQKPHVCGLSLGGTLSLIVAIDQGDQVSRVDALNPPGLHPRLFHTTQDRWSEIHPKPEVYIQKQADDTISRYGYWKEDWHIFHVKPPKSQKGPNAFADHALNYAAFAKTTFTKIDAKQDNHERRWRNRVFYTFIRGILYYSITLPNYYVVQPLFRSLYHPPYTGLFVFITTFCLCFEPWSITLPILSFTCLFLLYQLGRLIQRYFSPSLSSIVACHDPKLERNESLDLYKNSTTAFFPKEDFQEYTILLKECGRTPPAYTETDTNCIVTGSKAKIYDIKHTIHLIKHWGLHQPRKSVIDAVSKQHQSYLEGLKHVTTPESESLSF